MTDDLRQELYWYSQWREAVRILKQEVCSGQIALMEENAAVCQMKYVIYSAQYWASVKAPHA